mgnify:CR=1 FL=1
MRGETGNYHRSRVAIRPLLAHLQAKGNQQTNALRFSCVRSIDASQVETVEVLSRSNSGVVDRSTKSASRGADFFHEKGIDKKGGTARSELIS